MRLVCLHADTVDALKRLSIKFDDLTPNGLWSSHYHLLGLTPEQMDALEVFQVEVEDVTPAQLAEAGGRDAQPAARGATGENRPPAQAAASAPTHGAMAGAMAAPQALQALAAEQTGREPSRGIVGGESEVPLAQTRDAGARSGEVKADAKSEGKSAATAPQPAAQPTAGVAGTGQKNAGGKGGGTAVAPPQGGRKGQPQPSGQGGGQRYGTTRLRISVAGKYTEATVANGKIVVAGRTFDSPDQAAAELTKSRGDWTFWEYYDSADGKWRMLTRDWDTVLKSAAPGGR